MKDRKYMDLHVHLDGSITPEIAKELAKLQGLTLPTGDEAELSRLLAVSEDCTSLDDFLKCFALPLTLLQTEEGISQAVYLVLENMKDDVVYAEIRFAPQLHCQNGLTQEDAVKAAIAGLKKSQVRGNLILCCMRGQGNEDANFETVELARKYLVEDGGVVAIDLAGAEALFPTKNYKALFARAKSYGIPFTIHAGEAAGAESILDALSFGAVRIGHGIRTEENQELLRILKEKQIGLEMCPTSNRQTHAVADMSQYPLNDYLARNLCVTINTDDMAIERTTIRLEFDYIRKQFGITEAEEKILLENAVKCAFAGEETKREIRLELGL